jgi:hypothetical protein
MTREPNNPKITPTSASNQHRRRTHNLRSLLTSLNHTLSLGAYPTVPPHLRTLCNTARQHIYSISQHASGPIIAVAYTLRLIRLLKVKNLDGKLLGWYGLCSEQRLEAYLQRLEGELGRLRETVEARAYMVLGVLLDRPVGGEARAEEGSGWKGLEERYGRVGREFWEVARRVVDWEG